MHLIIGAVLEEVIRLLETEEAAGNIYELSSDQRNAVEEAQHQFKRGSYLTEEAAEKEIRKWLEEK